MTKSGPRVLVVDDERFFREAIGEALAAAGLEAVEAESGRVALERAEDPDIGVVVLDVQMPELDGIEVLRRLRAARPALRVIILSASTDQELVLDALRLGACDYLAKPLHDEELVLAVRRALESYGIREHWRELRGRIDRLVAFVKDLAARAGERRGDERAEVLRQGAVAAAAEVSRARRTSLLLAEPGGARLRAVAARGIELPVEALDSVEALHAVAADQGPAGRVFADGEPLLVEDARRDGRLARSAERESRYATHSFCVVPVGEGARRLGVLCATDREDGEPFDAQDLSLLRLLALQIAGPLAEAEPPAPRGPWEDTGDATAPLLPEDLVAAAVSGERDAELARRVCEAVTAEVDPARVLAAALAAPAEMLRAEPVALFLVDGATGELVREGQAPGLREDRERLPRARGLTGAVLQSGRLVAAPTPAADARFDPEVDTPADGEARPLLCVPLRLRGKTVGVFRAFLEADGDVSARAGEVLGAALSAAVRNVLLYRSLVETIDEMAEARRVARRPA